MKGCDRLKVNSLTYRSMGIPAIAGMLVALAIAPAHADELQMPLPSDLLITYGKGMITEVYQPEESSLQVPWIDGFQVRGSMALSRWDRLWLRLAYTGYSFEDPDFPGTTHRRAETRATLGYLMQANVLGGECGLGVGYGYQHVNVESSAKFPYAEPSFLFSPWLDQHGPTLLMRYRRPWFGPLWLALDCEGQSFPYTTSADSRLGLSPQLAVWASPGVTIWDRRLSLFYVYERTIGTGYARESHGAVLSLSLQGW